MCRSQVTRTLKTCKGHNRFILVRAFEPYMQQYGVRRVKNAQSGVYNKGIEREFGRGLRGAILGFLVSSSGPVSA